MWKDIKGYEGLYLISDNGEVKSLPKNDGNGNRERLLKFDEGKYGHKRVTLSYKNKQNRILVHRLVAETFIPKIEGKNLVHHINHDPRDNNINNLMWVNQKENAQYGYIEGTEVKKAVESAGRTNRKLTKEDIDKIKQIKITTSKSNRAIGEEFGVGRECIRRLLKGDTYNYE